MRALYSEYKRGARKRGFDFLLDYEWFCTAVKQPCTYCGAEPVPRIFQSRPINGVRRREVTLVHGLDRVDSHEGYTTENTTTCCTTCNFMKQSHSVRDFLAHAKRITEHNQGGK